LLINPKKKIMKKNEERQHTLGWREERQHTLGWREDNAWSRVRKRERREDEEREMSVWEKKKEEDEAPICYCSGLLF
jgi:hypothetical protein